MWKQKADVPFPPTTPGAGAKVSRFVHSLPWAWPALSLFFPPLLQELPWWLRWERRCLQCRRLGCDPGVGKIPWRREWQPTLVFLPGESHGQRSLAGYRPWGCKESDETERLTFSLSALLQASLVCCAILFPTCLGLRLSTRHTIGQLKLHTGQRQRMQILCKRTRGHPFKRIRPRSNLCWRTWQEPWLSNTASC